MTLKYFGGLTVPEAATALRVSMVAVERDWGLAGLSTTITCRGFGPTIGPVGWAVSRGDRPGAGPRRETR
jgi:hypothetical protein